jgi:hypothetical protein
LAEGERDKILQSSPVNPPPVIHPDTPDKLIDHDEPPQIDDPAPVLPNQELDESDDSNEPVINDPNIIHTKCVRPQQGFYKQTKNINKNLFANCIKIESEGELENDLGIVLDGEDLYGLPQEYRLAGAFGYEPKTLCEALDTPKAKEWQAAHNYEVNQLQKLKTWEIVDLPKGQYTIPHLEVFHEKRGPSGNIETYRARIVAGGHKQILNINYTEMFSAAAKMPSIRVILAYTAQENWELHQVDIKSAYLNVLLKETMYMKPPVSVLKPGEEGRVCLLKKALYGLKQAGCEWHETLSKVFMLKLGFEKSSIDHSMFWKHKGEQHTIIAVATDDMVIASKRIADIIKFKLDITKHFDITDSGEVKWFLNFEI